MTLPDPLIDLGLPTKGGKRAVRRYLTRRADCHHFMWGLWDLRDECWYGQESGPNLFPQYIRAAGAATLLNQMLSCYSIRVRIFFPGQQLFIKDRVIAHRSAEAVLNKFRA